MSSVMTEQVAEPYAQALMSVARNNNLTEQFGEDVRALINLLQSPNIQNLIRSYGYDL